MNTQATCRISSETGGGKYMRVSVISQLATSHDFRTVLEARVIPRYAKSERRECESLSFAFMINHDLCCNTAQHGTGCVLSFGFV